MGTRLLRPGGLLGSLVVVLVLAAGCADPESGAAAGKPVEPSPEETMTSDAPAPGTPTAVECGAAFTQTPGRGLTVTGDFPSAVAAGAREVSGTVTLTARRSAATRAVVTPQADAFLVRDGRVVTLPMAQDSVGRRLDLGDGSHEMPAAASLVACQGGPLRPGRYQIHVRVLLSHDDGSSDEALGGPWPLDIT